MRFWDTSAVLPLIVREGTSTTVAGLLREDGDVAVWWVTSVECAVALSRLVREGTLNEASEEEACSRLDRLSGNWSETQPNDEVRSLAALLSRQHPLKAADALQLAAALVWCGRDTEDREFVCLDGRLRQAASAEGFDVLLDLADEGDEV